MAQNAALTLTVGCHAEETCVHHWHIESPAGPTSQGICRKCGAVKLFRNFLPDAPGKNGHVGWRTEPLPPSHPVEGNLGDWVMSN